MRRICKNCNHSDRSHHEPHALMLRPEIVTACSAGKRVGGQGVQGLRVCVCPAFVYDEARSIEAVRNQEIAKERFARKEGRRITNNHTGKWSPPRRGRPTAC